MKTTTTVTDELYALLASGLWWEIRERSCRTLLPPRGLEADQGSLYATLYGTFRMRWLRLPDTDGCPLVRLLDIAGDGITLLTARDGVETRNDFRWPVLRRWILDCYGY